MRIAVGTQNAAKLAAVKAAAARTATVDTDWRAAEIVGKSVAVSVPAMPLTDEQLLRGARERAENALAIVAGARLGVGLEGGFHSVNIEGAWVTFLRGWAYATDGERGFYGAAPSVTVPDFIARNVIDTGRELAEVIDEAAGEQDIRNRQGAWGVFSRDLLTRAMSFESALIAAFAPFYNAKFYLGSQSS
jgi:inosine/xanthosine triphosphatase